MKKFSKLVAVSAAAMTFGITGVSALNNTNVVNADSLTADNGKLTNDINGMKAENSPLHEEINTDFGCLVEGINKTASQLQPNESLKNIKQDLNNNTYELGEGDNYKAGDQNSDWGTLRDTWQRCDTVKDNTAAEQAYEGVYNDANQVLADLYNQGSQPAASNANKQTANNDNKQNANNNNNANAQSNSSNKKAGVVANANNNAKNDNAQDAVANKQNTNNEANAQQNTVKSNANVEGAKTVANENESNSAKGQNKGAIAETQNENTTAAGETSTVVKAQAKSASNSAAQKNNTPVFPQTGEQASEILAVAGGLIIAATAAGIVVYKKRN
ncbi:MAG TPA: LPXTG cell wall anchor domain-containing protein [Ligilactobacillus aviarius]|nr:LPXTG cell wall anchor domain-containing protein [Ligilactobacillus aviarius]